MRRASLAGISPWETGTWQIRPGEIKLLRPQSRARDIEKVRIDPSIKSKPLVPFGKKGFNSEGVVIFCGIGAGFIFGALIFFAML